jgi:hypothetical protein
MALEVTFDANEAVIENADRPTREKSLLPKVKILNQKLRG